MKRYGVPLIVVIGSSFILYLFRDYTFFDYKDTFMALLTACALFIYGTYLSPTNQKSKGWVKKMFVMALTICLLIIQLGLLNNTLINVFLAKIGANNVVFYMFYIYFGYIFF